MSDSGVPGSRPRPQDPHDDHASRLSWRAATALPALVDHAAEGMLLADAHGTILYANGTCEHLLGYPPAELVGQIGFGFCRPEHLPPARDAFDLSLAHPGVPIRFAVDARHRDSSFRRLAVTLVNRLSTPEVGAVLVHVDGRAAGPGVVPDDDSDVYRRLFEHAPVGLGVAARDGTLLLFNDAMLKPGGYSREDIATIGNVATLYADPADRERVLALAQAHGYVWREAVRFKRKDGTPYDALLSLNPVWVAGEQGWYAVVEDMREQRTLESQLRQAQKMEEIGRITGGVAHDFNNILSVILLFSQAARRTLEAGSVVDASDLTNIEAAARSGAVLTARLLGFSRQADLVLVPTDLAAVVRGLGTLLRRTLPEDVTIEIVADEHVATVRADPRAIEEMLLNLATNASDAMPHGGTLRIIVTNTTLEDAYVTAHPGAQPGDVVSVSISDTGIGMSEEIRRRVFEPFFTTKPPGQGTGLGLAMVYGLTKQQHGFVDVASAMDLGTVVHLYFPVVPEAPHPPPVRASKEYARGGTETIVLVEDDDALRRSAHRVLAACGYTVLTAADGAVALGVCRAHEGRIDLVIADLVMPRMGGPDLYRALHAEYPSVKVLFVSGYGGRYAKAQEALGRDVPFLHKPWELNELLITVRRVLDD